MKTAAIGAKVSTGVTVGFVVEAKTIGTCAYARVATDMGLVPWIPLRALSPAKMASTVAENDAEALALQTAARFKAANV